MKLHPILFSVLLLSCTPEPTPVDDSKAEAALAELEAAKAELAKVRAEAAKAMAAKPDPALATAYEPEQETPAPSLCWQDYCPCESPETSLDQTICRNARAGIAMSDEQWSIGAMARDSKRQGDRLSAEMDDILADMR